MLDFLIKALGGHTSGEWDLQQVSLDAWRTRAVAAETTVELFKEILTREQARNDKLVGAHPNSENIKPPDMKPLGDRTISSWPRIKRELEKQERVKSNAQVSREEVEREIRSGQ